MKKKIGDLTIKEFREFCDTREYCHDCPLRLYCNNVTYDILEEEVEL